MASEARNYGVGTERALFVLAQGSCYFPTCLEPVVRFVEGVAATNAHIAHIRGANPDSARYDAAMTDAERAAFGNLVLLCKPHHDLVDRLRPDAYTVETITSWKKDREQGVAGSLTTLTDEHLTELLEAVMLTVRPQREVVVRLRGGLIRPSDSRLATGPLNDMDEVRRMNESFRRSPLLMVTQVRNTGGLRASVEDVAIDYLVEGDNAPPECWITMSGENLMQRWNPTLPTPLEAGDSLRWLNPGNSATEMVRDMRASGNHVTQVRASVRLGSGETILSETLPLPEEWT